MIENFESEGWEVEKKFKTTARLRKLKSYEVMFEDEVWALFANLGFSKLNKDRNFKLPYSDDHQLTQQIDVFAADDETILIVECKATTELEKKTSFKEAIEAIAGKKEGITKAIKKIFPNSKHKIKFIFATKNYVLSEPDKERLTNFNISHFDDEILNYYKELTKHLGISARFQLLGYLFDGQNIPELDNKIPAIQGKMGGHTYYSFSIEPEKLLKIGYVLHRNLANKKLMPTYQRLIKKARLKSVENFVQNGGFFPNSIIVNINSDRNLNFELANTQIATGISRIGILHLPKTYRSAYIIDGQHRLYGYANSEYKNSNSIPVVAFINLDKEEQVRIFMEINENQKAVSKSLRITLNADLLWNSSNLNDRITALKSQLAQDLGEDRTSPLFDKVIVGENEKSSKRCITIDAIKTGLDKSNFFGSFTKTAIKQDGTFFKGDNDSTYKCILPFLIKCFEYFEEQVPEEWNKGEESDGFLTINAGIESLIRIFSDIIDHLVKNKNINPKSAKLGDVINEVAYYLDPIVDYFKGLSIEEKFELKKSYGSGGRTRYWRILQRVIHQNRSDFCPENLDKYWKDEAKQFNEASFKMIRDIEMFLKEDFKEKLESAFGKNWVKKGVPPQVNESSVLMAIQKNREIEDTEEEVEPWDCLNLIDYRKIAMYGSNWRDIFEKSYTKPGEEKISGGKEEKTKWMQRLERIRNQNFHSYSVKEEEFEFLSSLHKWLLKK